MESHIIALRNSQAIPLAVTHSVCQVIYDHQEVVMVMGPG